MNLEKAQDALRRMSEMENDALIRARQMRGDGDYNHAEEEERDAEALRFAMSALTSAAADSLLESCLLALPHFRVEANSDGVLVEVPDFKNGPYVMLEDVLRVIRATTGRK